MPINLKQATDHIAKWQEKLGVYGFWAAHLFHSAHVTTAARIIQAGNLLSRNRIGVVEFDVANQEALASNKDAWNYVRLYFRPRTNFHLRTEGIKLLTDPYRYRFHMTIPVSFVFHMEKVVTSKGACFSNRKMAHAGMLPGCDWPYFEHIDFEKVYHEGPISDRTEREEIQDTRMAEVLIPDALQLEGNLAYVLCRINLEAETLCWLVGNEHQAFMKQYLRVATKPTKLFLCWGSYLDELSFDQRHLTLKVKPSHDYLKDQLISIKVNRFENNILQQHWHGQTSISSAPLRIQGFRSGQSSHWVVEVEDGLAFNGQLDEKRLVYRQS